MKKLLFVPFLFLAACGTTRASEPRIEIQRVEVPVPVPCPIRQNVGPRQTFPDTDAALQAAKDLFDRVRLLMAGRELREARIERLEDAADVC